MMCPPGYLFQYRTSMCSSSNLSCWVWFGYIVTNVTNTSSWIVSAVEHYLYGWCLKMLVFQFQRGTPEAMSTSASRNQTMATRIEPFNMIQDVVGSTHLRGDHWTWSLGHSSRSWSFFLRLRLAKVVKATYRLHTGARVNAALLSYLLIKSSLTQRRLAAAVISTVLQIQMLITSESVEILIPNVWLLLTVEHVRILWLVLCCNQGSLVF